MTNPYDERYARTDYYWGKAPSSICYRVLQMQPPDRPLKLLDIGCGEGRNAMFFARNGYRVTAFDASPVGVEKTRRLAADVGVAIDVSVGSISDVRLTEDFDILFSTGVLQYVPPDQREDLFVHYREHTSSGGLNVFSVFVTKPFIPQAPDAEDTAHPWISGEIFAHYRDWKIEWCAEEIFDCMSSGVPHQHVVNRIVARKEISQPAGRPNAAEPPREFGRP